MLKEFELMVKLGSHITSQCMSHMYTHTHIFNCKNIFNSKCHKTLLVNIKEFVCFSNSTLNLRSDWSGGKKPLDSTLWNLHCEEKNR